MLLVSAYGWYRQALGVANAKKKLKPILKHRRTIGEAIRMNRKNAGFTQETLAEAVGLNPKYIGEIERGEKIISIEALLRIAKAVKTPVRDFFNDI
jgi:DNA-binding XRE family transcriptional regulator